MPSWHAGRERTGTLDTLRRGGWADVAVHWHQAGFDGCRAIVRADTPRASALVLRRQGGGRGARLAAVAVRLGLPRWGAGSVTVLARRPAAGASAPPGPEISVLLTPRYRASRHVIGVGAARDGSQLTTVIKVPCAVEGARAVAHEAASLAAFQRGTADAEVAPRLISVVDHGPRAMLVESAVNGRPLDRRQVRRDPPAALDAVRGWVDNAPKGAPVPPDHDGRFARLIDDAARRVQAAGGPRQPHRSQLLDRTRQALRPLRHTALPTVFEHGDFSHPNLLLLADGRLAAVDWEQAEPEGLPGHDLFFFLGYLCHAVEKPHRPVAVAERYRQAVVPGGWARGAVEAHLELMSVDRRCLEALQLASWLRTVATLADVPGALTRSDPHRFELLWHVAIDLAEGGRR